MTSLSPSVDLSEYDAANATHAIKCAHKCGNSTTNYQMKCIPLGSTKSGKIKAVVFGRLFWKGEDHIKNIRYIEKSRITVIKQSEQK